MPLLGGVGLGVAVLDFVIGILYTFDELVWIFFPGASGFSR